MTFYLVYDATAKMPSGLLNGNVNQFGDFDECVGVRGKDGIQGQYCLATLQLDVDQSRPDLKYLHRLLHSHYSFRNNMTDVSTRYFSCIAMRRRASGDAIDRFAINHCLSRFYSCRFCTYACCNERSCFGTWNV